MVVRRSRLLASQFSGSARVVAVFGYVVIRRTRFEQRQVGVSSRTLSELMTPHGVV
jgi:hypothetical protein